MKHTFVLKVKIQAFDKTKWVDISYHPIEKMYYTMQENVLFHHDYNLQFHLTFDFLLHIASNL